MNKSCVYIDVESGRLIRRRRTLRKEVTDALNDIIMLHPDTESIDVMYTVNDHSINIKRWYFGPQGQGPFVEDYITLNL
jgi:hypothetical protein